MLNANAFFSKLVCRVDDWFYCTFPSLLPLVMPRIIAPSYEYLLIIKVIFINIFTICVCACALITCSFSSPRLSSTFLFKPRSSFKHSRNDGYFNHKSKDGLSKNWWCSHLVFVHTYMYSGRCGTLTRMTQWAQSADIVDLVLLSRQIKSRHVSYWDKLSETQRTFLTRHTHYNNTSDL